MGYDVFKQLTPADFDAHTFESETPSIVFFAAERCHVCKELLPTVEELKEDYDGKMNVFFVDVDKHVDLHKRFRLRGIPQLVVFKDEELKTKIGGLKEKEEIQEIIDSILNE